MLLSVVFLLFPFQLSLKWVTNVLQIEIQELDPHTQSEIRVQLSDVFPTLLSEAEAHNL